MSIDKTTLIARLRQIHAADTNAFAVYTELVKLAQDDKLRKFFSVIAEDEKRHVALSEELLLLLEK